jgi:addiction module RelE/StbE family toxin
MSESFTVLTTPAFERDFRKVSKRNPKLIDALDELIAALREDPYNYSGQHKIKKLAGVNAGEGQWRIRWRDYRLRYDIMNRDVVLHAFRHRKDAYKA